MFGLSLNLYMYLRRRYSLVDAFLVFICTRKQKHAKSHVLGYVFSSLNELIDLHIHSLIHSFDPYVPYMMLMIGIQGLGRNQLGAILPG